MTTILSDEPQQIKMLKEAKAGEGVLTFIGFGGTGDSLPPEHIYGIPLTDDILIRCGFDEVEDDDFEFILEFNTGAQIGKSGELFYYYGRLECMWVDIDNDIKYLHQLQNLVKLRCNQTIELK